ncbi:hypothetical protein CcarbDRAFT_3020 [Clostridium carboxidivorans P7]|uniref:Uncharacterized protein n=1 Tax=Clostridium carboxidivorans P7 TaxID=536227 RepID=C6PW53_9CLOT|nr:hypothetical protein [Clostridium carboxidivorans]EET86532.1 hypothetical protein CcarbDRAFT_3020 [Clostridium carboxidivorans P7]
MLIFSGIFKNAELNPEKICMTFNKKNITYGELVKNIDEKALFLAGKYEPASKIIIKK